ncbi:hypothetical protein EXE49_06760 [Halorubrum sp. ASP121]|uniref:archaellin/type IV pilin N-terminal domain-containing protein n=1 Tax=Halorubrum sp. ASP121 TaxID=1855858 RepID=UPI0010F5D05F|nr:archaellin/type IV pilin N-terminal domain-containing protein [Halorubrum sp. ASP121]TKX50295.1 hypothetical protein EXE49_06760 [Halorubrum sp. ASP121]
MTSIDDRGASPVIGTILMVAIVVVIGVAVGMTAMGYSDDLRDLTAPVTYGDNLIQNPGFERGNNSWEDGTGNTTSAAKIVEGGGIDGSNAVRLQSVSGQQDYVEQNLDTVLRPDAEYRLCAKSRLDEQSGGRAWVGVQHADGGPKNHLAIWEVTWGEYRGQCEYFKADAELKNITVWVYTEGDESVLADEFVLQRTQFLTDARPDE